MASVGRSTSSQDALVQGLEEQFGLRNLLTDWVRRQTAFSVDVLVGPICRTDLRDITRGTLPWNVLNAHSVQLNTKVLVQIEDVINIASSDPRSADMPRVLQMTLTDGSTEFVAVELEPLGSRISLRTLPGTKIVLLSTALVRRGRVLLTVSDFTFLGASSSNVWGSSYERKVAESLVAAGLPNPKASTFDSISGASGANGVPSAPPGGLPDMGGIADAIPSASEFDDDDDTFWAEAAAAADRTVAQASQMQINGVAANAENGQVTPSTTLEEIRTPQSSHRRPEMCPRIPESSRGIVEREPPSDEVENAGDGPAEAQRPISLDNMVIEESDEDVAGAVDIPEMPICDSDPVMDELDQVGNAHDSIVVESGSEGEDAGVLKPPALPLSRLESLEDIRVKGAKESIYRVYSMKLSRKKNVQLENGHVVVSALLDDGTGVHLLPLRAEFAKRLTRVACDSGQFQDDLQDQCIQIRKSTRGLHGFIQVQHDNEGSFVANADHIPRTRIVRTSASL